MGTDGCDQDDRVLGMAQRASGGEIVRRGSRRGGDADAVCLDGGEVLVVAEDFD